MAEEGDGGPRDERRSAGRVRRGDVPVAGAMTADAAEGNSGGRGGASIRASPKCAALPSPWPDEGNSPSDETGDASALVGDGLSCAHTDAGTTAAASASVSPASRRRTGPGVV